MFLVFMCLIATKKVSHSKNATLVHVFSQKKVIDKR